MKKILLLIAMFVGFTAAKAENKLYFEKTSYDVVQGGSVTIPLCFVTDKLADGVVGIQANWSLTANSGASGVTKGALTKVDNRYQGDNIVCAFAGSVFGYSFSSAEPLLGEDGPLVTIAFDASSTATGSYTLSFTDAQFKAGSTIYNCDPQTATVTINVVNYVTVDEDVAYTPIAGTYDAHLVRTFESGKYYTVCLPFGMTAAKRKAAWGSAMEAYTFASAEVGLTAAEDGLASLELKFTKLGNLAGLVANTPYIIKTSAAATDPEFASVTFAEGATVTTYNDAALTGCNIKFIGTYTPNTVVPENCLYMKSDKLYKSTGATKMKGTRAYFDISELYTFANDNGLNIDVKMNIDGFETAIDEIDADVKAEGWFDLNGRKLAQKPATKGVYINNGKKVVVK